MDRVWLAQGYGRDLGVEAFAEARDHLIRALQDPERGRERPPRGVLERLSRRQGRLFPDDAGAAAVSYPEFFAVLESLRA